MQRESYVVIYETLPFLLLKWLPAIFSPEEKKVEENVSLIELETLSQLRIYIFGLAN